jgi:hypothetical protein
MWSFLIGLVDEKIIEGIFIYIFIRPNQEQLRKMQF